MGEGGEAGSGGTSSGGKGGSSLGGSGGAKPDAAAGAGGTTPDASDDAAQDAPPDQTADSKADAAPEPAPEPSPEAGPEPTVESGPEATVETGPDGPADAALDPVQEPAGEAGDDAADAGQDAPVVAWDKCPGEAITLSGTGTDPRTGSVDGTTNGLANDANGAGLCNPSNGPDAIYSFTPDVAGIVKVTVTTTAFDATLYVRTTCGTQSAQVGCADSAGSSGTETVTFQGSAGTTYYVFVDGYSGTYKGGYHVDVQVSPTSSHEACPGEALGWTVDSNGDHVATAAGSTPSLWNDTSGYNCGYGTAPDAVYQLIPDTDGLLTLTATPQGWDAVMYVRSTCGTASSELTCKDTGGSGGAETYSFWATKGTAYWVFIDGSSSTASGAYQFTAKLAPQKTNEKCPGEALGWTVNGNGDHVASDTGDTSVMWNDTAGYNCGYGTAPEAVYAITPDVNGTLTVKTTPTGWDASMYVRSTCGTASSEAYCNDTGGTGGAETRTFPVTSGTTYYVFVDGSSSTSKGPYVFDAVLVPTKPSEKCPGQPATWTVDGNGTHVATFTGDTSVLWDDYDGYNCGSATPPDAVYAVQADTDGLLTVSLAPTGWDAVLYVRSTCATASSELTCQDLGGTSGAETWQVWAASGTTYYVFVDGSYSTSNGPYTLTATLAPATSDEKCPGETVVWTGSGSDPRTFTDTDDTTLHWNDYNGYYCGATTRRETVYAVKPDVDGVLALEVTPQGWDAAMYVRSTCATASTETTCQDTGGTGGKESYTLWATAGTTYYVFVDGATAYSAGEGVYTFNATLTPAAPQEKCNGAELTLSGTPPSGNTSGNTSTLWADYVGTGTCWGNTTGKDAVYHVVAPQTGTMKITMTPTGFDGMVYVRTGTCTGTQVGCADSAGPGGAEMVNVNVTVAGTSYYIFVDAYNAGSGAYTLSVTY
jgi:hypothetical protein